MLISEAIEVLKAYRKVKDNIKYYSKEWVEVNGEYKSHVLAIDTIINHLEKPEPKIDKVKEVFEYWRLKLSNARSKLDAPRRTKIANALKTFTVAECKQAIDGNKSSKWHQDGNHKAINLIFRSNDKIEYFIGLKQTKKNWLTDAQVDEKARTGESYEDLFKRLASAGFNFNRSR